MSPLDRAAIDEKLSQRPLELDAAGYFIIYVLPETGMICAKHFTTVIDDKGLARNPETGEVLPAKGKVERTNETLYEAATAKELCVKIFEEADSCPVSQFSHAAYLGREFIRAQQALESGTDYIQD
ncbi:MAG: DUF4346 domain-containing protein [Cyanobacteria bacterium P01_D01_bin.73]